MGDIGKIPTGYTITLAPQPLQTGVTLAGTVGVSGLGLNDIHIKELPHITLDEVKLTTTSTVTLDPKSRLGIDLGDINVRLKEIPSVRAHMPTKFDFGISILGLELVTFSLCGESMVVTEPYVPNKCELCEPAEPQGGARPLPAPVRPVVG
jgi:hypothetical protein